MNKQDVLAFVAAHPKGVTMRQVTDHFGAKTADVERHLDNLATSNEVRFFRFPGGRKTWLAAYIPTALDFWSRSKVDLRCLKVTASRMVKRGRDPVRSTDLPRAAGVALASGFSRMTMIESI